MTQITPCAGADSLPKQFVTAMRTLFDIMDDKKTGYVKLTDIENRWRDDRTSGLPQGVIRSLQAFASTNGLLTFDRFCAGLNLCLLKNQSEKDKRSEELLEAPLSGASSRSSSAAEPGPPPPCPARSALHPPPLPPHAAPPPPPLARPPVIGETQAHRGSASAAQHGPPKPPRVDKNPKQDDEMLTHFHNGNQYLHRETIGGGGGGLVNGEIQSVFSKDEAGGGALQLLVSRGRGPGDGKPASGGGGAEQREHAAGRRRREPRRHTLQNGIDYNVLKRMKQIEQEKEILVQGLEAIEKARDWYLKELAEVQDKMRSVSRMGAHVDQWSSAQQERLEVQRARVRELERQLAALAEDWRGGGGLALHINLALRSPPPPHTLQRQNQILTEEVTKKSERIAVLEREKSALIRELLVTTNRNKNIENGF